MNDSTRTVHVYHGFRRRAVADAWWVSSEALQAKVGTLSLEAQSKLEKDTAKKEAKAEAKADAALNGEAKLENWGGFCVATRWLMTTSTIRYMLRLWSSSERDLRSSADPKCELSVDGSSVQ